MTAKQRVNLRKNADIKSRVIRVLRRDEKIEVLDTKGDWATVEEGFIMKKFLK